MIGEYAEEESYNEFEEWVECWDCGGEGYHTDACECEAFEDTCCCAEPTPPICRTCKGKGGWNAEGE